MSYLRLMKLFRLSPFNFFRLLCSKFFNIPLKIRYKGKLIQYNYDSSTLYHLVESFPKIENQISLLPDNIDGCIIDGGANNGIFSLNFSKKYSNKIYAFEPSIKLASIIKENLALSNVKVVEKAISAQSGQISFYKNLSADQVGSTIKDNVSVFTTPNQIIEKSTVDSITLLDFMTINNIEKIGLLKLDIQGGEYEALAANPSLLEEIDILMIEIFLKEESTFDLINLIRKYYPNYLITNQIAFGADYIFYKDNIKMNVE